MRAPTVCNFHWGTNVLLVMKCVQHTEQLGNSFELHLWLDIAQLRLYINWLSLRISTKFLLYKNTAIQINKLIWILE